MARVATIVSLALSALMRSASGVVLSESAGPSNKLRGVMMESFIQGLAYKQVLRVCNAYPSDVGMEVSLSKTKLTSEPLSYKNCKDFTPPMKAGDQIDFKISGDTAGTFTVDELPQSDATLLMVIYRHDTLSTAVSFESHVFAASSNTQVAIMDAYRGKATSELRIKDKRAHNSSSELLRFESVVGVTKGLYEMELQSPENNKTNGAELVALPAESYVVIRCGVASEEGVQYPEELMVFPHSDGSVFSAAMPIGMNSLVCMAAAVAALSMIS